MTYKPKPIDSSHIKLSKDLENLAEILARNTHDVWAQERIAEGWDFGIQRNDARREHPDLVPYENLSESERNYDRQTARETIKALLARGYRIEAPERSAFREGDSSVSKENKGTEARSVEMNLASEDKATIFKLWAGRDLRFDLRSPQTYRAVAERLLRVGEPLVAYDVASEGLRVFAHDTRLRQLQALALGRSGAIEIANAELKRLYDEGSRDEETLGMLASTHKSMALEASDPIVEKGHLALAYTYYAEAYRLTAKYYSGINAATMAVLLGNKSQVEALAREVEEICRHDVDESKMSHPDIYWLLATQGEAALILGKWDEAQEHYEKAMRIAGKSWGDRQTSFRQARLLVKALGGDGERLQRWFQIPRVVIFVGHMIDQPERPLARFPAQLESVVFAAVRDRLKELDAGFGYASAACGSDILFHEVMLELGGGINVCLPYSRADFVTDSVNIVPGADWSSRFDRVLARASSVEEVSPERLFGGSIIYDYANRILHGTASERADQLGVELIFLAVWNKKPGDGPYGTASTRQTMAKIWPFDRSY